MAALATRPGAPSSATGRDADWRAERMRAVGHGAPGVRRRGPGRACTTACGSRLPGRYNVANALLAVALLDAVGVSPEQARARVCARRRCRAG